MNDDVIRVDFPDDGGAHLWIAASTNEDAVNLYNDPELTRMFQDDELTFVKMTAAEVPEGATIFRGN